jgi:hypothetical protein
MSQTPRFPPKQRRRLIKEHRVTKTLDQLARLCHCTRRTIDRDIAEMKADGSWWDWLEYAMLFYGQKDTVSDTAKFNKYADLYAKQWIKEKREQTTAFKGEVKHSVSDDLRATLEQYRPLIHALTGRGVGEGDPDHAEPVDTA